MTLARVAVVDDDPYVLRSFARLLRIAGMQPVPYESAEAFLADSQRPRFDCLVLDIQLAGMSGIELAGVLAATESTRTPFIYASGSDDPAIRARAEASGCAAYFQKAGSYDDEILETIRRLVSGGQRGGLVHDPRQSEHSRGA